MDIILLSEIKHLVLHPIDSSLSTNLQLRGCVEATPKTRANIVWLLYRAGSQTTEGFDNEPSNQLLSALSCSLIKELIHLNLLDCSATSRCRSFYLNVCSAYTCVVETVLSSHSGLIKISLRSRYPRALALCVCCFLEIQHLNDELAWISLSLSDWDSYNMRWCCLMNW